MADLSLFASCPEEVQMRRSGKELRTLFQYIDINGYKILFSVIDFISLDPYVAYINWCDPERYKKASQEKIDEVELTAWGKINEILNISFEELKSRSYK